MLGEQLDVVGAITATSLHVIHMRVGHKYSDLAAEIDHIVQALLGCEVHDGNRAGNHAPLAIFHELHVKQNFLPEAFAQLANLIAHSIGVKAALQVRVGFVRSHGPQRGVIPRVVGKQRARVEAGIDAALCDGSSGVPRGGFEFGELAGCDHEENQRLAFRRILANGREERGNRPLKNRYKPLDPCRTRRDFLAEIESGGKRVKRHDALGPLHSRRQRKPDAGDDAVGAPGVENVMNRFALVMNDARFGLHGDNFEGADRLKIAKASVCDRADSSRAAATKSANRSLDDRRGIAAQFPS